MVNQVLAEEIRSELRKLQQEREEYEDCCRTFSNEMKEEESEYDQRLRNLNQLRDECSEKEAKDYYYQCDLKEEDLRYQLQRLEGY